GGDILDDYPLSAFESRAARGSIAIADRVEKLEKWGLEAAAGDDLQDSRLGITELDVAHVASREGNGGIHDLEEQRLPIGELDQPRADLLETRQRVELGGQLQRVRALRGLRLPAHAGQRELRVDPRDQLSGREGLDQIVVGARRHAFD